MSINKHYINMTLYVGKWLYFINDDFMSYLKLAWVRKFIINVINVSKM